MSVNGSSATGHCSNVNSADHEGISTCADPTSSVLFDGVVPTLTGLDGDMCTGKSVAHITAQNKTFKCTCPL